jgi:hypothetical protein
MSTCVLYVDESGDPRKHNIPLTGSQTPLFILTGLALPLNDWRNIDRELLFLKNKLNHKLSPIKIIKTSKRSEHCEFKGNKLCAYRNKDSKVRHQYLNSIFEMVNRYEGKLFCTTVIKNPNTPAPPTSIYTFSLQYLVERFSIYLLEHSEFENGIIIADSTKTFNKEVAESHMSYIFGTNHGRSLINICEAPLFADSYLTAGLQIVDNLSSVLYSNYYHRNCNNIAGGHSYEHMTKYWDKIDSLQFKSRKKYIDNFESDKGYPKYGFRVIDHNKNP